MAVHHVPESYHAITPYLVVKGGEKAIEFYKKVFKATELMRMPAPGGKIGHAELRIGDSNIMLADEFPEMHRAPQKGAGNPLFLMVYVPDVDATFREALAAGAKKVRPVEDQFYGDRSGILVDPFGHMWNVATHTEDVTPDEMERRARAAAEKRGQQPAAGKPAKPAGGKPATGKTAARPAGKTPARRR